jgi:hypothetical protein
MPLGGINGEIKFVLESSEWVSYNCRLVQEISIAKHICILRYATSMERGQLETWLITLIAILESG